MFAFGLFFGCLLTIICWIIVDQYKTNTKERTQKTEKETRNASVNIGDILVFEMDARHPWDEIRRTRIVIRDIKDGFCLYQYLDASKKPFGEPVAKETDSLLQLYMADKS